MDFSAGFHPLFLKQNKLRTKRNILFILCFLSVYQIAYEYDQQDGK